MQPCKTGDQPYSDASPNGECSLIDGVLQWKVERLIGIVFPIQQKARML